MSKEKNRLFITLSFVFLIIAFSSSDALAIMFSGTGPLGSFEADWSYSASDGNNATLELNLKNTSPVANGGYLTGFLFNNPDNLITGILLSSTDSDFLLLGATSFDDSINGQPFGDFDVGAALGGNFEGGGNPALGIGVGADADFTFTFTGTDLDTITIEDFIEAFSSLRGEGDEMDFQFFVARFRGFEDDESDKVPGGSPPVPEPATALLFSTGLGLAYLKNRKKK